jgi:hypothetical protein
MGLYHDEATILNLDDLLETDPLSKALQRTYRLAREQGATDLANWLQLELGGYYGTNTAWKDDTRVPQYRSVTGAHFDAYGRRLQVRPELSFVNTLYLREPVEVLESIKNTRQHVVLQDPDAIEAIAKFLKVELATFHFDAVELVNVLSQIRNQLMSRAQVLTQTPSSRKKIKASTDDDEVIMLSPNFYGLGLHLRPLVRRWFSRKAKSE